MAPYKFVTYLLT